MRAMDPLGVPIVVPMFGLKDALPGKPSGVVRIHQEYYVQRDRYGLVLSHPEGLQHLDDLARIMLILFATVEGHVHRGRKQKWKKNDNQTATMVSTLGPCPNSRETGMVSQESNVCFGCVRVSAVEEAAGIKVPLSLSQRPMIVDIVRTVSPRSHSVKR